MTRFTPTRFVLPLKDYPVVEVSRHVSKHPEKSSPAVLSRFESCAVDQSTFFVVTLYFSGSAMNKETATHILNRAIRFGMKHVAAPTPDLETVR